jgi:hypothetical protein
MSVAERFTPVVGAPYYICRVTPIWGNFRDIGQQTAQQHAAEEGVWNF